MIEHRCNIDAYSGLGIKLAQLGGKTAELATLRCVLLGRRFLKWDDAPCDLNSVGGIKVVCEVEISP